MNKSTPTTVFTLLGLLVIVLAIIAMTFGYDAKQQEISGIPHRYYLDFATTEQPECNTSVWVVNELGETVIQLDSFYDEDLCNQLYMSTDTITSVSLLKVTMEYYEVKDMDKWY